MAKVTFRTRDGRVVSFTARNNPREPVRCNSHFLPQSRGHLVTSITSRHVAKAQKEWDDLYEEFTGRLRKPGWRAVGVELKKSFQPYIAEEIKNLGPRPTLANMKAALKLALLREHEEGPEWYIP